MSAITSVNYCESESRSLLPFFSACLSFFENERLKFHCLCIYSLWSRDYWLYKVIQTDEWILYWLKCKYGLTLGSSHAATDAQPLSSLSFIVSQRSRSVFLKLLIKWLQLPSRSGDLGKWKTRKWDVDIDSTILNRGHLSFYIKWTDSQTMTRFTAVTFLVNIMYGSIMTELTNRVRWTPLFKDFLNSLTTRGQHEHPSIHPSIDSANHHCAFLNQLQCCHIFTLWAWHVKLCPCLPETTVPQHFSACKGYQLWLEI